MKLQRQIAKNRVVLALPVALLMAANAWSASESVTYINDKGVQASANCIVMDKTYINAYYGQLPYSCFVLRGNIEFDKPIKSQSNISLILEDGASLTINFQCVSEGDHLFQSDGNIRIFGQKNQTGSLTVNNTGSSFGRGLSAGGTIQIYGGHVTVTSSGKDAIWANGDIDIYGGDVSAIYNGTGNYDGIESESGNININWVNSLYASSYSGNLKIVDGLTLKDEGTGEYSNSTTGINAAIKGKTLTPTDYLVQFVTNADNSKRAIINGEYSGEAVNIPSATDVVSIDYNRTFTAGVPATVVLPFSLPEGATTNAKFYRLKQVVQVDGACAWNASAQNIATDPDENAIKRPQANEPYIVMLNEGNKLEFYLSSSSVTFNQSNNPTTTVSDEKWSFIGVYSFKEWKDPDDEELGLAYAFAGSNEGSIAQGKFGKIAIAENAEKEGYPYANPFRAYLKKKDNTVKLQCPQAFLGQNSAQYSLGHNSETIDVQFIDEDENGEKTTFMARMNTRTGEFTMLPNYDAKGRKIAAPKVRGAYYGKKILKNKDVK